MLPSKAPRNGSSLTNDEGGCVACKQLRNEQQKATSPYPGVVAAVASTLRPYIDSSELFSTPRPALPPAPPPTPLPPAVLPPAMSASAAARSASSSGSESEPSDEALEDPDPEEEEPSLPLLLLPPSLRLPRRPDRCRSSRAWR